MPWWWASQASRASVASGASRHSGVRAQLHCTCTAYHALRDLRDRLRELRVCGRFGNAFARVGATIVQTTCAPASVSSSSVGSRSSFSKNLRFC